MNENTNLNRKCLMEVRIGHYHEKVHPAWRDGTNEGFLICYDINLVFDDQSVYLVQPCDIEISGRYPRLGLAFEKIEKVNLLGSYNIACLPMLVKEVIETDYLGEDVINQYVLVLENGTNIIIRHIFPPMTMGIKMERAEAWVDGSCKS